MNSLKTVVKSTVKTEHQNVSHTVVELLRQVLKEADAFGLSVKVEIANLENE